MRARPLRVGKVQFQLLQVLWESGPATARQITERLSGNPPIAHSTVQTLLRQLEAKGLVDHAVEERTFVFRATRERAELNENPLRDLLTRAYHGSVVNLMTHLLKNEPVSPEELDRLRQLIAEIEEEKKS
jgi:BlaI family penicillinase repressor